ncbi:hypothetical protein P3T73_16855 [Kiritimatiellota bacterium B12222]|nr:hypothetical protein P3T73_16855 [Kiritimatiellota bacterium B12222]
MIFRNSLSVVFIFLVSLSVQGAVLIGFEGEQGTSISDGFPYTESGFTFTASGTGDAPLVLDEIIDEIRMDPSDYLTFTGNFGANVLSLTLTSNLGSPFSLLSMQAGLFAEGGGFGASTLTLTGNQSGGGTVIHKVVSSETPGDAFVDDITFDSTWGNLDSVEFSISNGGFFYGLDVDNISLVVVPELSSLVLMGIAFVGMLGRYLVRR